MEGIEVKTKFPVARIKRIVQADEDVGKVAQVTPVVVCKLFSSPLPHLPTYVSESLRRSLDGHSKPSLTYMRLTAKALELFMISLALKSATEARARSSKRVTSSHLKIAVLKDDQFDFLTEVVGKIPDAPAPSAGQKERGQRKRESNGGGDDGEDEDDEVQEEQEKPKRRRKSTKAEGEGVTRRRRKEKEDT